MKKVMAALLLVFVASTAHADHWDAVFTGKDGGVYTRWNQEGNYLEVKTKKTTYRVYPCGQLEKLTWKELNPNEDGVRGVNIGTLGGSITTTPYWSGSTSTLQLNTYR